MHQVPVPEPEFAGAMGTRHEQSQGIVNLLPLAHGGNMTTEFIAMGIVRKPLTNEVRNGIPWNTQEELTIGPLPGRKSIVLYHLSGNSHMAQMQPLAYFVSVEAANEAMRLLGWKETP